MLRHHMALFWSAKSNWFRRYKHVAALRPTIIKQPTITPLRARGSVSKPRVSSVQGVREEYE